ncbi:MAG TPA: hypothetical protein VHU62_10090, partial [Mycobacterium sp.]|nr:hypothetical protein [Mycobacterium sp.]
AALTAIRRTKTPASTHIRARRSRGVSGSVGGVLPALIVGGSFVWRSRLLRQYGPPTSVQIDATRGQNA